MNQFPFQIIAGGVLPQNLDAGLPAPNTSLCTAISGGTGIWEITADDPTAASDNTQIIVFPGPESNIAGGIAFGQSSRNGRVFLIESYTVIGGVGEPELEPGDPISVPLSFIIVRFPPNANAGD